MDINRVIGHKNRLPWHKPEDMRRFKELTTNQTVLMGKRTYDSLGKPLPNRENIVLSTSQIKGVKTISSIDEVRELNLDKLFVIGGEQTYRQFINQADVIKLTLIYQSYKGDSYFPSIPTYYTLTKSKSFEDMIFLTYHNQLKLR